MISKVVSLKKEKITTEQRVREKKVSKSVINNGYGIDIKICWIKISMLNCFLFLRKKLVVYNTKKIVNWNS